MRFRISLQEWFYCIITKFDRVSEYVETQNQALDRQDKKDRGSSVKTRPRGVQCESRAQRTADFVSRLGNSMGRCALALTHGATVATIGQTPGHLQGCHCIAPECKSIGDGIGIAAVRRCCDEEA